jgi:hypothetical protein
MEMAAANTPYEHMFFTWTFEQTITLVRCPPAADPLRTFLSFPQSCWLWLVACTCGQITHYLTLGFEMELYNSREFAILYW